jgi:Zn-dependent protease
MSMSEPNASTRETVSGGLPPEVEAELRRRAQGNGVTPPPETDAAPPTSGLGAWLVRWGPVGVMLFFLFKKLGTLAVFGKYLLPALKFLKLGKILTTSGTMLLSVVVYAQRLGWPFAVGFVLSIFVHEMGHVYVAWRMGVPVSAPIFIPGFGALILQKRAARSVWDEALIGIGGPVGGTLAALLCLAAYGVTGSPLMLALAYAGAMINLFNLIPIMPLDGGWITGAVSPRLWLIGLLGMVALFLAGWIRNPLILLLLLLSLPRLWHGLRHGKIASEDGTEVTPHQRLTMGCAYIALCGLLLWLMGRTHAGA